MKLRQNWLFLVVFLVFISLFLVACERPLPGGYNDTSAPADTTLPGAPVDVPEVDSEDAYPAQEEPAAPENLEPADAAQPAEGYPSEEGEVEQGLTTEDQPAAEEPAPDTNQAESTETEEQGAEETTDQSQPADQAETSDEAAAPAEPGEGEEAAETPGTHTVAAGENLYRIGLLYGINWVDLAQANGITDPASLSVGQVLILPGSEAEAELAEEETGEADAAEEAEAVEETSEDTSEESADPGTYTVQPGDTLNKIGALLGVDWTEIAALNGIVGTQIYAGQVLIVPVPGEVSTEPEAEEVAGEETTYVVQEGDSVYSVAFENNIPWTLLVEVNNIEAPYTLEVGQNLVIPAGE